MILTIILNCLIILNINNYVEATLEHLIVTYLVPEHYPADTIEGLKIFRKEQSYFTLTRKGNTAAFNLGRELAEKYADEFNLPESKFQKDEIWSFSVDLRPAQEAALYLDFGLQNLGAGLTLAWTQKEKNRVILKKAEQFTKTFDPNKCPGFFREFHKNAPKYPEIIKAHPLALQTILRNYSIAQHHCFLISHAYETFMTMEASKYTIPNNIKPLLSDLEDMSKNILFVAGKDLKQQFGGRLLSDILADLEAKVQGKPIYIPDKFERNGDKIKASFFAAPHEVIASQVAVFNPKGTTYGDEELTVDTFYPGQGAVHLIELHKEDETWKVKVQYRRSDSDDFQTAQFPECDSEMCDYSKFKKLLRKFRLCKTEQDALCKEPK